MHKFQIPTHNPFPLCNPSDFLFTETVSPKPSTGCPGMATMSGGSPAKVDNSGIATRQAYSSRVLDNFNLLRQNSNNSLCDVEIVPGWYTQSQNNETSSTSSSWLQRSSNKIRNIDAIEPTADALFVRSVAVLDVLPSGAARGFLTRV